MNQPNSKVPRFFFVLNLSFACVLLLASGERKDLPQKVYVGFRTLGGIYIKFLQLLVLQSDSFKALSEYDIYEIYDNVAYEPFKLKSFLKTELGDRASGITLDQELPFAAGSFGQVYKASYQGKPIIIKVLRPSVIKNLSFDLKMLKWFSRLVDLFSNGSAIAMRRVYRDLAQTTRHETNYVLEADYANGLYKRYRSHRHIFIPYTYRQLCSARLICQDYVSGVSATDLLRLKSQGVDPQEYIAKMFGGDSSLKEQLVGLGTEMLGSVFFNGSTYGDPHPGNIKFLSGNRVGLIDYGLQAPAPKNTIGFYQLLQQYQKIYSGQPDYAGYSRVLLNMYGGDVIRAANSLDDYYSTKSPLLSTIVASAEEILQGESSHISYLLENNKLANLFNNVINKNNRFCLRYELDGPELVRAGGLFITLVAGLGMKEVVLAQTYSAVVENVKHTRLASGAPTIHHETAIEVLASWMDQVAYKNPKLHRQIMQGGFQFV